MQSSPVSSLRQALSLRFFGLLLSLAAVCSLLPVFAGQAFAVQAYCIDCGKVTEAYVSYDLAGLLSRRPTCTEAGYGSLVCSVCGNLIENMYVVPALGHDYSASADTATCTAGGSVTYTCSRCGDSYEESTSALGHAYVRTGTDATCTEDGHYTYTCSRCGDSYTQTIAALGHDYEREVVEPTCTEPGAQTETCRRCGDVETEVIPALGHSWPDEWTVEKKASFIEDGVESRVCQRCGEREERTIPKHLLPLLGTIGGAVVVIGGIAFGLRKYLAAKALAGSAAAVTATVAAEAGGFELVKLTEKKIFADVRDEPSNAAFLETMRSRPNIALTLFDPVKGTTLSEQIEACDPDAVLLDCADEAGFDALMRTVGELRAVHEDVRYEVIVPDADALLAKRAAAEAASGALFAYALAGQNKYVKLSRLVIPLYKDLMKDADSLESIGTIADLFGIPAVSTLLSAVSSVDRAKDLADVAKDALTGVEMDAGDGISVVNNIAQLLGIDAIAAVSELSEDVLDTHGSVTGDEEGGIHKTYKAGEVAKDVGDVIGTLLS